jgi:hypothetical protein
LAALNDVLRTNDFVGKNVVENLPRYKR